MNASPTPLPDLTADLVLLHPPAFFDFRARRDIYFPFLSTSGDVPITPLYEYFPLGFRTLQRFLVERGYAVKLLNLGTLLLQYPALEVDAALGALKAPLVGIDLHWMVHVQGSLAIAQRLKRVQPEVRVILGGISTTYFADEVIQHDGVDMAMRGYDTHEPMAALLKAIKEGGSLTTVPNLLWKSSDGDIRDNGFTHTPRQYRCGVDWSQMPRGGAKTGYPLREVLSTQTVGCVNRCGWCGGSREAFQRVYRCEQHLVTKPMGEVRRELASIRQTADANQYHFYSAGAFNQSPRRLLSLLDSVKDAGLRSVNYEQFRLPAERTLRRMVEANPRTSITLSPQSHDLTVAKLAGGAGYTNGELEDWIDRAVQCGIQQVDLWYMVGMPEQDSNSVMATVDYCGRLLERFGGGRVNPMICPMIPYLDPGSTFFEQPSRHGYRVFYRTLEEHRFGMSRASLVNRLNYETRWLSRYELVDVGFRAVVRLMEAKQICGLLPRSLVQSFSSRVQDTLEFLRVIHEVDCLPNEGERVRQLDKHGDEILRRNNEVFFSGVLNQAFPIHRKIGGRWFEETGWEAETLRLATN